MGRMEPTAGLDAGLGLGRAWKAAVLGLLAFGIVVAPAHAQGPPPTTPPVFRTVGEPRLSLADAAPPKRFVTKHRAVIGGKPLSYTATAGETYVTNSFQEPIASIFTFAYVKDGPPDPARPVMFVFNGGPGSASLWLHMGVIGPRRLVLDKEVNPSNTPPFGVRDNPFSPLDAADLVFIDPVGTGFSRAMGHAKDSDFFSVDADAESIARFIEKWLTENGRWNSPKYLMGESYGTIRAAVLPRALMGGPSYGGVMRGVTVNGVILVGSSLSVGIPPDPKAAQKAPDPRVGSDLPGQAVTAWYHNKIDRKGRSAQQVYDEVNAYGAAQYAEALFRLDAGQLPAEEKAAVAAQLAAYTGLPAAAWLRSDLRMTNPDFLKKILADQGLDAGAYDSRYTMSNVNSGGDPVADDPAMGKYVPGFIAAFHQTLRDDLKVSLGVPYGAIMFETVNFKWNYSRVGAPLGQSYAAELATAMRRTDKLRVMVASGYFDMVSTPAGAALQIRRGGLPADRVRIKNYESGHMLYLGDTAEAFANDVRNFISEQP